MDSRHLLSATVFALIVQVGWTQVPQTMSYEGVLRNTSGGLVPDGNHSFTFNLYASATGGTSLWSENHPSVPVSRSVFSVILGEIAPLNAPFNQQYWLGVSVDGGAELTPRTQLRRRVRIDMTGACPLFLLLLSGFGPQAGLSCRASIGSFGRPACA